MLIKADNAKKEYVRKEWMHPEDMDLEKATNHVLYLKHLKAYEFILDKVDGKTVLEIGCGSGYGNKLLALKAEKIYSVDIDPESLEFARKNNFSKNVEYILADVTAGVEIVENSCDICVCYQVIEHIDDKDMARFINEIKRIIKPKGEILFTTPNRKIRLFSFQKPTNKYHKTEYSSKSLKKLLSNYFSELEISGLQTIPKLKEIEIKRTGKSLKNYFLIKPAKKMLKLFGIKGPIFKQKPQQSRTSNRDEFITENFWFDKNTPDDSIDLMAFCINH